MEIHFRYSRNVIVDSSVFFSKNNLNRLVFDGIESSLNSFIFSTPVESFLRKDNINFINKSRND